MAEFFRESCVWRDATAVCQIEGAYGGDSRGCIANRLKDNYGEKQRMLGIDGYEPEVKIGFGVSYSL